MGQDITARDRFVRLFVLCVAALAALTMVLLPLDILIRHLKDDSFYYFQTARNIALGYGSTFDRINLTNGYHPLWMLNLLPVYTLFANSPLVALRVALLVAALYHTLTTLLIYQHVTRLHSPAIGAIASLAWALSPVVLRITLNGMESGVYALTLAGLVVAITGRLKRTDGGWQLPPARSLWGVGLVAMLCVLARLDAVLVLTGLGLCLLAYGIHHRQRPLIGVLAVLAIPAIATLVVYMAFNQWQFGVVLPISGLIKRATLPPSLEGMIGQWLWPFGPIMRRVGVWPTSGALVLAVAVVGICATVFLPVRILLVHIFRRYDWLWLGSGLLYTYLAFSATYIANWYYVPMLLLATLVAADLLALALAALPSLRLRRAALGVLSAGLLIGYGVLATSEFHPRKNDTIAETLRAAFWVRDTLPADAVGASWSAGVLAYFSERPIVNLDGLINSREYYQAMRENRAAQFAVGQGVDFVFDMFPVPESGDTTNFTPDTQWTPFLQPYAEWRYSARNVGISSMFKTIFPSAEQDAQFMWKVWRVVL